MFDKFKMAASLIGSAAVAAKDKAAQVAVDVGESTAATFESGRTAAGEAMERYWPSVERVLVDGLLDVAEDRLQDENFLQDTLRRLYAPAPLPLRLLVTEDFFVKKCMTKKDALLGLVLEKKQGRKGQELLPAPPVQSEGP